MSTQADNPYTPRFNIGDIVMADPASDSAPGAERARGVIEGIAFFTHHIQYFVDELPLNHWPLRMHEGVQRMLDEEGVAPPLLLHSMDIHAIEAPK